MLNYLSEGLLAPSLGALVLITLAMTHVTIVSVTVYLHRYSAHRALDMHPVLKHFFRFWLWLSSGQNTKEWTAIQMAGIHPLKMLMPGVVVALALGAGTYWMVGYELPLAKKRQRLLVMAAATSSLHNLQPGRTTLQFKNFFLSAKLRDPKDQNILYDVRIRKPDDERKEMMDIFVYDTSNLTEELFQTRLDNILARKDHLENFVASTKANPKQFPDVGHRLGEIRNETLIVWGRDDRFVPMDTGIRLVNGIQRSELHIFNRCGHWVQWEYADKFNRMVLDFLTHGINRLLPTDSLEGR